MGQFDLNGTFTYLPDPSFWTPEGKIRRNNFASGRPLKQVEESGIIGWDCLTQQQYGELHTRWAANNTSLTSGKLPEEDGSGLGTYDTIQNAWWHEPLGEARGGLRFNVRMRVTYIGR